MSYSLQIHITWKKYTKPLIQRKNHILRNLVWYVNLLGFRHTLRIRCYLSKTARDKKVDITHVGKPALCEKQTNHSAFTTVAVNHLLFLASCVDLDLQILKIIDRKGKTTPLVIKKNIPALNRVTDIAGLADCRMRERSGIGFWRNPRNCDHRAWWWKHAKIDVQWQWVFLELIPFTNLVNESSGVSCSVNIFVSVMFIQSEDFFYLYGCFKPAVCFLASAQFHVNFKILAARL